MGGKKLKLLTYYDIKRIVDKIAGEEVKKIEERIRKGEKHKSDTVKSKGHKN